jgi:hypothetical protein
VPASAAQAASSNTFRSAGKRLGSTFDVITSLIDTVAEREPSRVEAANCV